MPIRDAILEGAPADELGALAAPGVRAGRRS